MSTLKCVRCGRYTSKTCYVCNDSICEEHLRYTLGNQFTTCIGQHYHGIRSELVKTLGMQFVKTCNILKLDPDDMLEFSKLELLNTNKILNIVDE